MKALVAALLIAGAGTAPAQTPTHVPGDNLRIYLLTFGPGDAVWERFGHNAIAVADATAGTSIAYNWGMFSFDQPGFVRKLMKGRMEYWMQGFETNAFIDAYIQANRSVYVQELNLSPEQRIAMRDFLLWNAREENKFYRYDYYRDNCSTRVRDAIDRVLGGALKRSLEPRTTDATYRSHTAALTYTDLATYTGLMLAMGPRIDVPLSAWEEGFIPMELREWARSVQFRTPDGTVRPLVMAERTMFEASRTPLPDQAPSRIIPFTLVSVLFGALLLLLGRWSHAHLSAAFALAVLLTLVSLPIGFFGTLISLLWAFTDHVVTYGNENVLQANPLSLVLAVLAPMAVTTRVWARRWAVWIALFVAGCSVLGFLMQILPQFDQVNGEIIGLLLPLHCAIATVLWQRWRVDLSHVEEAEPPVAL